MVESLKKLMRYLGMLANNLDKNAKKRYNIIQNEGFPATDGTVEHHKGTEADIFADRLGNPIL